MLRRCAVHCNTAVSIGGWCGPALMLGKLGIRTEAYPFDFSRVTMDGVIHFVENGFGSGFFPPGPPPYKPECVGIWVLFRGQHTAFAHFDLNDVRIQDAFKRKMERWDKLLHKQDGEPVTFFRTVSARNPLEELTLISTFNSAVEKVNPNLNFRTVVSVHDQGFLDEGEGGVYVPRPATALAPMDRRTMLWGIEYCEPSSKSLFDQSQSGYGHVVSTAMDEGVWDEMAKGVSTASWSDGSSPLFGRLNGGEGPISRRATYDSTSDNESASLVYTGQVEEVGPQTLSNWKTFDWRSHDNIALIDGIASVGGTCTGVGSTAYLPSSAHYAEEGIMDLGACPTCKSTDWHKAGKPFRTERPFTDEEDELLLIHLYKILTGGDKVEAVEQLAHEMSRGAYEIICRIQFLTSNSTKIADGIDME